MLVIDGAQLHPQARVARRCLGEALDLRARLFVTSEPNQEIAEPLDERRILGIGARGTTVHVHRRLGIAARLVHVAECGPRAVVIGVEFDRLRQATRRFVPGFRFDRQPAEQELCLRRARIVLGQAHEDGARAIELLLLDLVAGERQIRVLGARIEGDDALELRLCLRPLFLRA